MSAKNRRATLRSELMSGTTECGRKKSRQVLLESNAASTESLNAGAPAATPRVGEAQALLYAKGSATAVGFRPWHWSYESTSPPVDAPPPAAAPIPSPVAVTSPSKPAPARRRNGTRPPPEAPRQPPPNFDYPCNAAASAVTELLDHEPDFRAERAALLATTKAIAALIGKVLEAREMAVFARREELRRAHGIDGDGYRANARIKSPTITAESLIAEIESARRGSVRELRKRVRPFSAAVLASAWSR